MLKILKWGNVWFSRFLLYVNINPQNPLNTDKCIVLHFGANNPNNKYRMGSIAINSDTSSRDLGLIIDTDLLGWYPNTVLRTVPCTHTTPVGH